MRQGSSNANAAARRFFPLIVTGLLIATGTSMMTVGNASAAGGPDLDLDGLDDYDEVNLYGTDPGNADTDSDGLSDGAEVLVDNTNPLSNDTDGDGIHDRDEVDIHNTDPRNGDTDFDVLYDGDELVLGTDPLDSDTDDDGFEDGWEVQYSLTNPLLSDTDGDGIGDRAEDTYSTNPLSADTDGDGTGDGAEVDAGANPLDPTDGPAPPALPAALSAELLASTEVESLPEIPVIGAPLVAPVAVEPQDRELPATGAGHGRTLGLASALLAAGAILLWSRRIHQAA